VGRGGERWREVERGGERWREKRAGALGGEGRLLGRLLYGVHVRYRRGAVFN